MKKLVEFDDLTSFREPDQDENDIIDRYMNDVKLEMFCYTIGFVAFSLAISFIQYVLVSLDNMIEFRDAVSFELITIVLLTVIVKILKKYLKLNKIVKSSYKVLTCKIHSIEPVFNFAGNGIKLSYKAYIHTLNNEYCTKPLLVESDSQLEVNVKMLLVKFLKCNEYKLLVGDGKDNIEQEYSTPIP